MSAAVHYNSSVSLSQSVAKTLNINHRNPSLILRTHLYSDKFLEFSFIGVFPAGQKGGHIDRVAPPGFPTSGII